MYLYMQQKVLSLKAKFSILDGSGADKYYIEGKMISLGKKLTIFDTAGNELAHVNQKLASLMPKFNVEIDGKEVASIKKKMGLKPKYIVEGPGWEVQGDFLSHDYRVVDGSGNTVVDIDKKYMSWGDTFELNIPNEDNEVLALAIVLAIDAVMDKQGQ